MPSPTEALLRLTLGPGTVFYTQDRELTSGEPHYFLVLNQAPRLDQYLVLCVTSSKIAVVKRRCELKGSTAIEISPVESGGILPRESIVDCGAVFLREFSLLAQKVEQKQARVADLRLPLALVEKLRQGVLGSPTLDASIRKMLET